MTEQINNLRTRIVAANEAYRTGNAIITDVEYDAIKEELEELNPNDALLDAVGFIASDDKRKQKLPIPMASMHKVRLVLQIIAWLKGKGLPLDTLLVLTPKFDGLSFCVNEAKGDCWTRGDGTYGQVSNGHFNDVTGKSPKSMLSTFPAALHTFGEVIMAREKFMKYAEDYSNPRNFVAGLINSPDPTAPLADCVYIRYGLAGNTKDFTTKTQVLDYLNLLQQASNAPAVNYEVKKASELTEDYLKELFMEWNTEFQIDGIIIEVNDLTLQKNLGREHNNNPAFARAYKGNFEEVKETTVTGITWKTSKQGLLKPIIQVKTISLDGVNVTNITGNNANYVQTMRVGKGAVITAKRSGFVIPQVVKVVIPSDVDLLPTACSCGCDLEWTANSKGEQVELVCSNETCESRQLMRNISFFQTLEIEGVSDGVITQFYDAGYTTIAQILAMSEADMYRVERFGKRKAEIVYNAIHQKLQSGVTLPKLQHATGLFKNLGSKKLALLEHFTSKPTVGEVEGLDGFSTKSAEAYIRAYDQFNDFIAGLPINIIQKQEKVLVGNDLDGQQFVFTGVRRADIEGVIESRGGKIGGSVSKNTTFLVVRESGSGSAKENKALSMGVKILTVEQLEALLT